MTRRELQPGSVPSDVRPTCPDTATLPLKNMSSSPTAIHLDFEPPDLIDQCHLSVSSSERESSFSSSCGDSVSLSSNKEFENFEFEISEFSTVPSSHFPCHNLELSQFSTMEADCKDINNSSVNDEAFQRQQENIMNMLGAISSQMMTNLQNLQEQMLKTDEKLMRELHLMSQENEKFKREVRAELVSSSSQRPSSTSLSAVTAPVGSPTVVIPSSSSHLSSPASVVPSNSDSVNDFQTQLLTMLNDTFCKLSTTLGETKSESKSEWPKFSGDLKKFRTWYMSIMAQISLPPWRELYDSNTNDVVTSTTNELLNGKLYSKLILTLEGQPLQDVITKVHLRANGVQVLQELNQTYRPKNIPEVVALKTSEFWSSTKRKPSETIDVYYNRFQELLEEINASDIPIPTTIAMRHFLFTLGKEFEPIQNNYRIDNLPSAWKTTSWPSFLVLCRDYYNSVNPMGPTKMTDYFLETNLDRNAHHKKIKQWFMNPAKFSKDILAEQQKFPGRCIYHLSKTHTTDDCHIKKECAKQFQTKRPLSSNTTPTHSGSTTGQLRHLTEEVYEDAVSVSETNEVELSDSPNDTNEFTFS